MNPWKTVEDARLKEGTTGIYAGTKGRWWELDLECGHEVERRVKYVPSATPNFGRSSRSRSDVRPHPRRIRCERCKFQAENVPTGAIDAAEQARVIAVAEARDNGPRDFRDAVHEMCHVIDTGLDDAESWDRNTAIHEALSQMRPGDQFRLECNARAAEHVACELAGIEYEPDKWLMLAAMEAVKGGLSAPMDAWRSTVKLYVEKGVGAELVAKVRALAARLA